MKKIFWGALVIIIFISIGVFLIPAWAPRAVAPLPDSPTGVSYDGMKIFGQPVMGDLDGDGDLDAAVIVVDQPGGSGTFYYLTAAINTGHGYQETSLIGMGDRIAPQTTEIRNGIVIANYADRKPDEPFTTAPSVGKSLYAKIVSGKLIEISAPAN